MTKTSHNRHIRKEFTQHMQEFISCLQPGEMKTSLVYALKKFEGKEDETSSTQERLLD